MATKAGIIDTAKSTSYVPGPGQYNINLKNRLSSAKYTMRAKTYEKRGDVTPGPGNYNVRTEKINVPSYKFGREKKMGLLYGNSRYVPGPGNYEFKADILYQKHPKFSFGKELRKSLKRYKTPGPGQYEYKKYIGNEGPKITMSAKFGSSYYLGVQQILIFIAQKIQLIESEQLKEEVYIIQ